MPEKMEFSIPDLGNARYEEEIGDAWKISYEGSFSISVSGFQEPDPELLNEARRIHSQRTSYVAKVHEYLREQSLRDSDLVPFREEIRSLRVESVNIWRTENDQPSGMIYFSGGDKGRVWRCDFSGDTFSCLGFDD